LERDWDTKRAILVKVVFSESVISTPPTSPAYSAEVATALRRPGSSAGYELSARLRAEAYGGEPEGYGPQADG